MENKEIFRKKAVDRVASPEQLNDYIHVTSPAIWMALIGIILILAGALVWATFGSIYTTVEAAGTVSGGNLTLYVSMADRAEVEEGMTITVNGRKTTVREILNVEVEEIPCGTRASLSQVCRMPREIVIRVSGRGFLYNMVRIIAGTLMEIGRGAKAPEEMPSILDALDRRAAGPTAPACGLTLVRYEIAEPGMEMVFE